MHRRHERCGGSCATENLPGLCVIQGERGKETHFKITHEEKNFEQ